MALTVQTRIERTKALGRDANVRNAIIYTILFYGIKFLEDQARVAEYEALIISFCQWLADQGYTASIGYITFWHFFYDIPITAPAQAGTSGAPIPPSACAGCRR